MREKQGFAGSRTERPGKAKVKTEFDILKKQKLGLHILEFQID
jgi:hypothetical protein